MISFNENRKAGEAAEPVLRVHKSALKHGLTEEDICHAFRMAIAIRARRGDSSCIAAAGPDCSGRAVELLAMELHDGSLLVFHAMGLARKMAHELDLG